MKRNGWAKSEASLREVSYQNLLCCSAVWSQRPNKEYPSQAFPMRQVELMGCSEHKIFKILLM
jgi:hypothetical protein